jgi:hypothetical protein
MDKNASGIPRVLNDTDSMLVGGAKRGDFAAFEDLVILDGTPLLDIKPYTARFDRIETTRNGWLDEVDDEAARRRGRGGYQPKGTT